MKKAPFLCLLILASLSVQKAYAVGIGIYGTGGVSAMTYTYSGSSPDVNSTDYHYGGGLIIDTTAARDTLLGYRFTAGYERYEFSASGSTRLEPIHRFSMTHTLGFGFYRTENIRLWLGPQIGIHYLRGRYNASEYPGLPFLTTRVELDYIGMDAMLALGINVNVVTATTLFMELGIGYTGNFNINADETGHAPGMQAKIGVMFRIDDSYIPEQRTEGPNQGERNR